MSPSSTELRAGLFLGRDAVSLVVLTGGRTVLDARTTAVALQGTPLYRGMPQPAQRDAWIAAVTNCTEGIRGKHLPLHVVIPDAATSAATFELDHVPADRAALDKLVEHRLARELGSPAGACVSQLLGKSDGKHLVLGISMDRAWLQTLREVLEAAGLVPWSLSTASTTIFNSLSAAHADGGALISLTQDAWALWVWDTDGHARPLRSQWRDAGDPREVAAEAERALIAYTGAHPNRAVSRLHVWSAGGGDALADLLDQRTQSPCGRHHWPADVTGGDACMTSPGLAVSLMAAL